MKGETLPLSSTPSLGSSSIAFGGAGGGGGEGTWGLHFGEEGGAEGADEGTGGHCGVYWGWWIFVWNLGFGELAGRRQIVRAPRACHVMRGNCGTICYGYWYFVDWIIMVGSLRKGLLWRRSNS